MKAVVLFVMITVSLNLAFSENRLEDTTATILQNLSRIENSYFKYLSPQERQEAVRLLNETRGLLVSQVGKSPLPLPTPIPTPVPTPPVAKDDPNLLSEQRLQALYETVKNEMNDDAKTPLIVSVTKKAKISCVQLEKLVMLYRFDSSKEDLLKKIADNIVDPDNIRTVLRHVDSSFTRESLAKFFLNR